MQILDLLLFALPIGWIIACLDAFRIGLRDKTYGVPFVSIALNTMWVLIGGTWYVVSMGCRSFALVFLVWGIIDILLLTTYFRFGYREFESMSGQSKPVFIGCTVLAFLCAGAWQAVFCYNSDLWLIDTAFTLMLLTSMMFVYMLLVRKSSRGQSMLIAVAKCIGSLGPTLYGWIRMRDCFMTGIGAVCFIIDCAYIVLLYRMLRAEER